MIVRNPFVGFSIRKGICWRCGKSIEYFSSHEIRYCEECEQKLLRTECWSEEDMKKLQEYLRGGKE